MCTSRLAKCLLVFLVLRGVSPAQAGDAADDAVNRLSTVQQFAFGGIGFAGVTSKGETDFKVVLALPRPTALSAFERGCTQSGIRRANPMRSLAL